MYSAPLSGMRSAETLLEKTAANIASTSTPPAASVTSPAMADTVELTGQMGSLIQELSSFEASSKALEVEASMAESTPNVSA